MKLKRGEDALFSGFDLMPVPTEQCCHVSELLSTYVRLLRAPLLSALSQVRRTRTAQYEAELAAMDEAILERSRKIKEMRTKCTYSTRSQTASNLLSQTAMVLTNSVMEIAREKDETKMLLQQM